MPSPKTFAAPRGPRAAILLWALFSAGCSAQPGAPALDDEPVYRNDRAGFRFSRPEGWIQWSRGNVPDGKLDTERLLVEYKCGGCDEPATLEVTVASIAPSTSLTDYVMKNTLTGEDWRLSGRAEEFTINSEPAVRFLYTRRSDKKELAREIVAFRRGDRVYFFKGFYDRSDTRARREIRSTVETVVW
jgi:hypothetical protein